MYSIQNSKIILLISILNNMFTNEINIFRIFDHFCDFMFIFDYIMRYLVIDSFMFNLWKNFIFVI